MIYANLHYLWALFARLFRHWIYAYRSTQNFDDYILGGRKMGSFVTAMSAGASDMSGWLLMGLPGAIFSLWFIRSLDWLLG